MNERPSMLPERLSALFTAPRTLRRAAGRIAAALGLTVVFTAAVASSAILHLRSRVGLRAARGLVNDLLGGTFKGRLEIGEITDVTLGGLRVERAVVYDEEGRVVIDAEGISARFSTIHLLESLFIDDGPKDPLWIAAPSIRIERGVVHLLPDASGAPSIGAAFAPRTPPKPNPNPRPLILALPRIELGEVEVDGDVGRALSGKVTGLVGSVGIADGLVVVDIDEANLSEDALAMTHLEGRATYHLRVDPPAKGTTRAPKTSMWMGFHGRAGESPVAVDAMLSGQDVVARVDLPSITPAALRALVPGAPVETGAHAIVEVEGTLPELTANAHVDLDPTPSFSASSLDVEAHVDIASGPLVEASFVADRLDPRAFSPSLPAVTVRAQGRARLAFGGDGVRASVELSSHAAVLRATDASPPVVVPAIDAVADLVDDTWIGSATIYDRGASLDTRFSIRPGGGIAFAARGDQIDLAKAPRIASLLGPGVLRGSASLSLRGQLDGGKLAADARVTVFGLAVETTAGPVRAESVGVIATLDGALGALDVDAEAHAVDLSVADQSFDRVELTAKGALLRPAITLVIDDAELGRTDVRGAVDLEHGTASGLAFTVERGGEKAEGKVASVAATPTGIAIEGVTVAGELGSASASLRVEGGELLGTLVAENVDLDRLRKITGLSSPIGGIANLDISIERTAKGRRGHVDVEIQRGQYLVEGIAARFSARFDGDDVEATGFARLVVHATEEEREEAHEEGLLAESALCDGPIAEVRLSSLTGKLRGPLLAPSTWLGLTGEARLSAENVNLKCLSEYPLVSWFLPVEKIAGLVSARLRVAREVGDALPSLRDVTIRTLGLEIVGPDVDDGEPWEIRAIDVAAGGEFDGRTGHATAKAALFDGTLLADVTGEITVDTGALGRALATGRGLVALLESSPMGATVDFPRRSFADTRSFPSFVREALPPLAGDVRFDADASGTIAHPSIQLHADAFGVGPAPDATGAVSWAPSLDVELDAVYDDPTSTTAFTALVTRGPDTVARVDGGLRLSLPEALHPKDDAPLVWSAGAVVAMNGLPLESFPALSRYDVSGHVSGTIVIADWNHDPSLDARLSIPDLEVGDVGYGARVDVHLGANALSDDAPMVGEHLPGSLGRGSATALVELRDADGKGAVVFGLGASQWKDNRIPGLALDRPAFVCAVPDRFEIGILAPLVVPTLSHLEGKLTGAVGLGVTRAADLESGTMSGSIALADGVVFIPQLGQELSAVRGEIVADPSGRVHIDDLTAQGIAGELNATLDAKFSGLDFDSAKGHVRIAEGKEIPFTLEGVPVGFASTEVDYEATFVPGEVADGVRQPATVVIRTNVPIVRLQLPDSSSRDVQDLDGDPTITTSEILAPPETPRSADATIYDLRVKLDRAVVSGTDLGVTIAGGEQPIRLVLGERLTAEGEVTLASGFVSLRGKRFVIDRGLVRLRPEEVGNPYVNLTAHWEDPNGARVYIDYVGVLYPITEDKIRFRSDPPRSKEDIIATLLFGTDLSSTPEGQPQTEATTQGVTTLAADLTSTLASSALNALFRAKNVSVKVDTTSGSFRGSVEWRASEGLTLGLSGEQVQGSTAAGSTQQAGAQFGGTIEWRLSENWFLRSTFGAGVREPSTGVDVFWTSEY